MKSTVETLSPTRVRLAVEVPFDELTPSVQRAYKKIAGEVRVPGFRPGKAPAAIIDRRVGRGVVLEEAVQDAVPRAYADAVQETGTRVIGQPDIEVTKLDDGDVLTFTAEVDVRPEIDLPDLASIAVTVDPTTISDEDVDAQTGALRERFAILKGVERPVQEGDYVSIDLAGKLDGEEVSEIANSGLSYEVGSDRIMPGLDTALSGMSAEESKTFTTGIVHGEHAGKDVDIDVTVRSVKEKELPELDDEFAQTASEFDTLDELQADIRSRLGKTREAQQGSQAHERVLEALLASAEVPLPESAVDAELSWRRENIERQLAEAGMDQERYLQTQEQTVEEFEAEMRGNVEQAVKTQLVLDALADQQQVSVSDQDLTEHIVAEAQRYGIAPQALAQQVQQSGSVPALVADVRRNKAMRRALSAATVTDTTGAAIDLTALLGPDEDDEAADLTADPLVPRSVEPGSAADASDDASDQVADGDTDADTDADADGGAAATAETSETR